LDNIWLKALDNMAIICHMGQSGALRGVVGEAQLHVYLSNYILITFTL